MDDGTVLCSDLMNKSDSTKVLSMVEVLDAIFPLPLGDLKILASMATGGICVLCRVGIEKENLKRFGQRMRLMIKNSEI